MTPRALLLDDSAFDRLKHLARHLPEMRRAHRIEFAARGLGYWTDAPLRTALSEGPRLTDRIDPGSAIAFAVRITPELEPEDVHGALCGLFDLESPAHAGATQPRVLGDAPASGQQARYRRRALLPPDPEAATRAEGPRPQGTPQGRGTTRNRVASSQSTSRRASTQDPVAVLAMNPSGVSGISMRRLPTHRVGAAKPAAAGMSCRRATSTA